MSPSTVKADEPALAVDRRRRMVRLVSPAGFVAAAVLLAACWAVLHLLGWREHMGFLSGTAPPGNGGHPQILAGVLYASAWFGLVLLAPVFLLGAAVFALLLRLTRKCAVVPPAEGDSNG
jgi:hypothetical protein